MNSMMARRGPDDEGIWSDRNVTLGFRRLSIIDLSSNGHQPMSTADGRYHLVFNGEVYNFSALRDELIASGVSFASRTDTEVVLYSLAVWGKRALERFNGMFALAFYDSKEARLLLARDPVGIKPLYYAVASGLCVFGSQFDQVLSLRTEIGADLCQVGFSYYMRLGYTPAPHTVFKQIRMLEAGSFVEIDSDFKVSRGSYWQFPVSNIPDLKGEDMRMAVDEVVGQAVRRQLVSDVPVGCFLSGGIDSPLVAAKIREQSPQSIKAFTLRVRGFECDESDWAAHYAQSLGVEQVFVDCDSADLLGVVNRSVEACQEPLADYSILPTLLVSEAASASVKVMLSGDGGDELFWGYFGRFASVLARCGEFEKSFALRSVKRGLRRMSGHRNPEQYLVQRSVGEWVRAKHTRIFDENVMDIFPDSLEFQDAAGLFRYDGFDQDETAKWLRWNEFVGHLSMVLLKVDRASMFSSLEVRVPLLDMRVVELASRIDWKDCLNLDTGLGKIPLRESLGRYVSKQSVNKRGFTVPMAEWIRGPLQPMVRDVLLGKDSLLGLPLNRAALTAYYDGHCSGRVDRAWGIWVLFSLALWEQRYNSPCA